MERAVTAAQLVAPEQFELVDIPRPSPGPGEVRVAIEGCGICASNLPAWSGRPWFDYPLAPGQPGHEGWGRVEALGKGVPASLLGKRVGLISEHAYAEAEVVPEANLILTAEHLQCAPLEPFGCIFNIARRAFGTPAVRDTARASTSDVIAPEQTVAIVGLGFIGLGLTRWAASRGANVLALSRQNAATTQATALGATAIDATDSHTAMEAVMEKTRGAGCDVVIECTGHQGPLDVASNITAEGGRLVIAGYHQDGLRQVDLQQWNWKGIDVINAHERSVDQVRAGMRAAATALAEDPDWLEYLITHSWSLADINSALRHASERPTGFVKGVVTMDGNHG